MPDAASCQKAISFMAEDAGRIAAITQQQIMTGSPDYALRRIRDAKYETGLGHSPRYIRFRTVPPRRTAYQPLLPSGNQTYNVPNPQTGALQNVVGDVTGRGCSLPAEKLQYGYDVKGRCIVGKAWEAGPWCIMDLLEKDPGLVPALIGKMRQDIPRYGKEDFGRQLLRDVITYSDKLYSVGEGFPRNSGGLGYFPAVPTGGPSIGFIRNIEEEIRAEGWDEGAGTPVIGGRPALQVYMSRNAIEFAIVKRKEEFGLRLESRLTANDDVFGETEIYEGIQFIEAKMPTRGYLRQTGTGTFEFVEIDPYIVDVAQGEGFWPKPNPDYRRSKISVGNAEYRVLEVGYIIHPNAMVREAMSAPPSIPGKVFTRNFDFSVTPIPDFELADRGCNKDDFWFGFRSRHAYAPRPVNPELMTAFLYLAPTPRYQTIDPWSDASTFTAAAVGQAALTAPQISGCLPCVGTTGDGPREPIQPTCDNQFPTNGVGTVRQASTAYSVQETAGNLTVVVNRVGGSSGAASVAYTTTAGTATAGTNYTTTNGTLNWADGVSGPKYITVPILNHVGDDDGKQFTVVLSSATGATLGTTTATVTILDADENV